jgi:Mg2+ and Co2+ transporter CorA
MVGGLFGMNVKVPFQDFLRDEDEMQFTMGMRPADFTWDWWMNSILPLIPFFSIVTLASTMSLLFYLYSKDKQWI